MATEVPGTQGYERVRSKFSELSESIDFGQLHACLVDLLPKQGAKVLDLGAGSGRDAAALAGLGCDVVAVEPTAGFLADAKAHHLEPSIRWVSDSLPRLSALQDELGSFDFILCHGVWQHLNEPERAVAMPIVGSLLRSGGLFALGLRHGPAGAGTHYFPADAEVTIRLAEEARLSTALRLENQPSAIPNKTHVTWTRLAFRKD